MASSIHPRTPVLAGGGQFTQRTAQQKNFSASDDPLTMLERVSRQALADTKASGDLTAALDTVAVVRFTADSSETGRLPVGQYTNAPRSLARRLKAHPEREIYTAPGGNTPQYLVNRIAEDIAQGRASAVLIAGCENLATLIGAIKSGHQLNWGEDAGGAPELVGDFRRGVNDIEKAHGLYFPVNVYPMLESAIRGRLKRTPEAHQAAMGRLFAQLNAVAAGNPDSWFPQARSAEEIATPSANNRYIGYPYTKYLNAVIEVDQAAAVVMCSYEKAKALGIPDEQLVFLHGCADVTEVWHVTERPDLSVSPAIRLMGRKAFAMAGKTPADMQLFDLYSCFPSAVEYALEAFGLSETDPRGFTVTGGLPYFGGAGNNYVMHSIVTMMQRLRARRGAFGLVTANGWFATKHACGIYSTTPVEGAWAREAPDSYQREIDALEKPVLAVEAEGRGMIEAYTVVHDRTALRIGIVLGRLADGRRFLANTPAGDEAAMRALMEHDSLGRAVTLRHEAGKNIFAMAA